MSGGGRRWVGEELGSGFVGGRAGGGCLRREDTTVAPRCCDMPSSFCMPRTRAACAGLELPPLQLASPRLPSPPFQPLPFPSAPAGRLMHSSRFCKGPGPASVEDQDSRADLFPEAQRRGSGSGGRKRKHSGGSTAGEGGSLHPERQPRGGGAGSASKKGATVNDASLLSAACP